MHAAMWGLQAASGPSLLEAVLEALIVPAFQGHPDEGRGLPATPRRPGKTGTDRARPDRAAWHMLESAGFA